MSKRNKLILAIIDGASPSYLEKSLKGLNFINNIINNGSWYILESIDRCITPIAMAVLATGVNPTINGITSTKIHVKGRGLWEPIYAMSSEGLKAEPIWASLARQGFKVVVSSYPQALPDKWGKQNLILLDPYRGKEFECSEPLLLEGESEVLGERWKVENLDGKTIVNYPTPSGRGEIVLNEENRISPPIEFVGRCKKRQYIGLRRIILPRKSKGIYLTEAIFKKQEMVSNFNLDRLWEDAFKKFGVQLDGEHRGLTKGHLTLEEYMETVKISSNFFLEYTKYLMRNIEWDVIITYNPIIDNLQHLFSGYQGGEELIYEGYKMVDRFLEEIYNIGKCPLVVASDHGIIKVKKRVNLNLIFLREGLLHLNERGKIDWGKTKVYYSGGGIIRFNMKGREKNGIVSEGEYSKLISRVTKILEGISDPDDGNPVFTAIFARTSPASDGEGDIEVFVREDYTLSPRAEKEVPEIEKLEPFKSITGDHGLQRSNDKYGILIIYEQGTRKKGYYGIASISQVAATVSRIVNAKPPSNSSSSSLI